VVWGFFCGVVCLVCWVCLVGFFGLGVCVCGGFFVFVGLGFVVFVVVVGCLVVFFVGWFFFVGVGVCCGFFFFGVAFQL
ncbi:hypothetical protein DVA80_21250, partial [Acinetobacter baumannii]|uniref:hypothetical protein n=1 Tax=Acinetobacter baumannii TaxID=470 RepID=UPI000E05D93F